MCTSDVDMVTAHAAATDWESMKNKRRERERMTGIILLPGSKVMPTV